MIAKKMGNRQHPLDFIEVFARFKELLTILSTETV